MILSICSNYIIGILPASLSPILFLIGVNPTFYGYFSSVTNMSLESYFFLFYDFNLKFRRIFLEKFCLKDSTKTKSKRSHPKPNHQTL